MEGKFLTREKIEPPSREKESVIYSQNIFSVYSKNGLQQIQIPYLRASHKLDFICLFLALWLELLSLIAASSAVIRTISFCLDTMTGGIVRIYILGKTRI